MDATDAETGSLKLWTKPQAITGLVAAVLLFVAGMLAIGIRSPSPLVTDSVRSKPRELKSPMSSYRTNSFGDGTIPTSKWGHVLTRNTPGSNTKLCHIKKEDDFRHSLIPWHLGPKDLA